MGVVKWVWQSERLVTQDREYGTTCNLSHREKEKRGEEKRREEKIEEKKIKKKIKVEKKEERE